MSIVKNIHLKIDKFTLDIEKIEILDQGITALSGPSGSGKTTFFRVLMGVHRPKGWSWIFDNLDLAQLSIADRKLGVVFQGDELFFHMTAKENVLLIAKSRQADIKKIDQYIDRLNLRSCWNTKAALLSGGEKQRVSLLRAFLSNSRMILLDEPFSALDNQNREEARRLIKDLAIEFKIPVLMISHSVEDIKHLSDKVIKLDNGQLI